VILEVKLHASFGERLVSARKVAGLSLAALAEKTGNLVTRQAINKYERGKMGYGTLLTSMTK